MPYLRFFEPVCLHPEFFLSAKIGDAAVRRGLMNGIHQLLLGAPDETPAVGQALALGVQTAVDYVHFTDSYAIPLVSRAYTIRRGAGPVARYSRASSCVPEIRSVFFRSQLLFWCRS